MPGHELLARERDRTALGAKARPPALLDTGVGGVDRLRDATPIDLVATGELPFEDAQDREALHQPQPFVVERSPAPRDNLPQILARFNRGRANLGQGQAQALEREDPIELRLILRGVEALVGRAEGGWGEKALLIVELDRAHRHACTPGERADRHESAAVHGTSLSNRQCSLL